MTEIIVIKYSPEITIKSPFVRKELSLKLLKSLKAFFKRNELREFFSLERRYDQINITPQSSEIFQKYKDFLLESFRFIPGVSSVQVQTSFPIASFQEIFDTVFPLIKHQLENKKFRVRVKRTGKHSFTSVDLEKFIGGGINKQIQTASVSLKNFDEEVFLHVKEKEYSLVSEKIHGVEGFPINSEKRVVSLISGGFDSSVSSYFMMRKGCPTDFLFFNLGGIAHQNGVEEVCDFLTNKFSFGYNPHFITINFVPVIQELIEKIDHKYRGVILKRCMMRVAEMIAEDFSHAAIITGESLAQVSSQTLINLKVIENVLENIPLYRPLFGLNKSEIIQYSDQIGTTHFAAQMPEYCGVISQKPTTRADEKKVREEEKKLFDDLLNTVFENRSVKKVSQLELKNTVEIPQTAFIAPGEIILDLREEKLIEKFPLSVDETKVVNLPFYEVDDEFEFLDQTKTYLFFCDKGVMSHSHAQLLWKKGFKNIKIFKPHFVTCEAKK